MNKLVFGDIEVSKKEKKLKLNLVDVDKIVVSNKIKRNNETSKVFIGHLDDLVVLLHLYVLFYHK